MTGVLPAMNAFAHWPIRRPALKLLVANSASTALCGSVAVSRAMTTTPLSRAFWMLGTIALVSLGVMRMPLAPALTMFSSAVTWPSLSPSLAPAPVISLTPSSVALAWAPSFIFTKNGLVSVFVIRPTMIWPLDPDADAPGAALDDPPGAALDDPPPLHAAATKLKMSSGTIRLRDIGFTLLHRTRRDECKETRACRSPSSPTSFRCRVAHHQAPREGDATHHALTANTSEPTEGVPGPCRRPLAASRNRRTLVRIVLTTLSYPNIAGDDPLSIPNLIKIARTSILTLMSDPTTLSTGSPRKPEGVPRPTIRDVAALARVSLKTVSRVINSEPGVSAEMHGRVTRAIEQLSYRPNLTASSLRRTDGKTATIGTVLENVANPFSAALQRAIEDVAREHGVLVFASSADEDGARERALAASFVAHRVDGLIIVPADGDQSYLANERRSGLAVVFVDRPPRFLDADWVASSNRPGAAAATSHLVAHGHRRIGFIGDVQAIHTAAERLAGYRAGLAAAGIAFDEALVRVGVHL